MNGRIAAIAAILIIALPIGAGFLLNIEPVEHIEYQTKDSKNITDLLINGTLDYTVEGPDNINNSILIYGSGMSRMFYQKTGTTITSLPLSDALFSDTYTSNNDWQTFTSNVLYSSAVFDLDEAPLDIRMTRNDGSVVSLHYDDPNIASGDQLDYSSAYNTVCIDGDLYQDIIKTEFKANSMTVDFHYIPESAANLYADPSYGWTIYNSGSAWATGSNDVYASLWTLKLYAGETTTLTPGNGEAVTLSRSASGMVTVDGQKLGNYDYVRVDLGYDNYVVYGVPGNTWPAMKAAVKIIKQIEIPHPGQDPYDRVYLTGPSVFRVDSTQIKAGTYPAIQTNYFDIDNVLPGYDSYDLKIDKVGVYGDLVFFAGQSYTVSDGKIQVGTRTYDLNGLSFRSLKDGDTWHNFINKSEVSTSSAPSIVGFSGGWSMVVKVDTLDQVTVTVQEWVPGHFGIDISDACLVGLMGCLAAFIGLAMYGRRSGAKIGPLILVCGLGAVIFLIMI